MDPGRLWWAFVRVALSLLCAGVFYFAWLAAFLLIDRLDSAVVETILWLSAPVATATGFAVGVIAVERLTGASKTGFWRILVWPLIGCAIGATAVYWFGPMLIVFGMFAAGTASLVLREVVLSFKRDRSQ